MRNSPTPVGVFALDFCAVSVRVAVFAGRAAEAPRINGQHSPLFSGGKRHVWQMGITEGAVSVARPPAVPAAALEVEPNATSPSLFDAALSLHGFAPVAARSCCLPNTTAAAPPSSTAAGAQTDSRRSFLTDSRRSKLTTCRAQRPRSEARFNDRLALWPRSELLTDLLALGPRSLVTCSL